MPIGRGQITFAPTGRRGTVRSAAIESGRYVVDNVPPGPKTVLIVGLKQVKFAKTRAEMAEMAKQGSHAVPASADEVPADAVGNNQTVETKQGEQEMNFDLKRPGAPARGSRVGGAGD